MTFPLQLDTAIQEFLQDARIRGSSPFTLSYYERVLRYFREKSGIKTVDQITVSACKEYLLTLMDGDLASSSVQTYVRGLRAFLNWLYANEYIETNVTQRFKLPKAQRKVIDVLTDTEIQTLLNSFDTTNFHQLRNLCIVLLMLDSGLRLNETITLRQDRFHLAERYAIVDGKCNKQRIVPIGSSSVQFFEKYLSIKPPSAFLICKSDGEQLTADTVKDLFRKLKKTTGISRLHPHLLRHSFATRYLENGGNIYNLQTILGHSSLEMVKKYLHIDPRSICKTFDNFSPVVCIQKASNN